MGIANNEKSLRKSLKTTRFLTIGLLMSAFLIGGSFLFTEIQKRDALANLITAGTASPISGIIGQSVPRINLTGSTIENEITTNFFVEGCESSIPGKVMGDSLGVFWQSDEGLVIPDCATIGNKTGVLKSSLFSDVPVSTSFNLAENNAKLTSIATNKDSFVVNFVKGNFTSGSRLNFYYTQADSNSTLQDPNNLPSNQIYSEEGPFVLAVVSKPTLATKLCVLVSSEGGTVIPNSGNCLNLPVTTVVSSANIGDGTCSPDVVIIGQSITCTFPLSGGSYYINPGIVVKVNSTSTAFDTNNCEIQNNSALVCTNVPTVTSARGQQQILLSFDGQTVLPKGIINLVNSTISNGFRTGRLYFVGLNDAQPFWDINSEFNSNYLQSQKYKEGPIKLKFEDIKNPKGAVVTSGNCTFKLFRYGNAASEENILKTYTGSIVNGSCEATLSIQDQTINYYRVRVETNDSNTLLYNSETLILTVGGTATSTTPEIEL